MQDLFPSLLTLPTPSLVVLGPPRPPREAQHIAMASKYSILTCSPPPPVTALLSCPLLHFFCPPRGSSGTPAVVNKVTKGLGNFKQPPPHAVNELRTSLNNTSSLAILSKRVLTLLWTQVWDRGPHSLSLWLSLDSCVPRALLSTSSLLLLCQTPPTSFIFFSCSSKHHSW